MPYLSVSQATYLSICVATGLSLPSYSNVNQIGLSLTREQYSDINFLQRDAL